MNSKYHIYVLYAVLCMVIYIGINYISVTSRLYEEIDAAKAKISYIEKINGISDNVLSEAEKLKEQIKNEARKQAQITNEAIENNKDFSDMPIPSSIRERVFNQTISGNSTIHSTGNLIR